MYSAKILDIYRNDTGNFISYIWYLSRIWYLSSYLACSSFARKRWISFKQFQTLNLQLQVSCTDLEYFHVWCFIPSMLDLTRRRSACHSTVSLLMNIICYSRRRRRWETSAQPVIPPNLFSALMLMNIIAWPSLGSPDQVRPSASPTRRAFWYCMLAEECHQK